MTTADPFAGSSGGNEELVARNAAMRDRVDTMIENLQRRTGDLAQAQSRAVAVQGVARSDDGAVTVRTNAAGVPTAIEIADGAFARTTPEKLAALLLRTTQDAARSARAQATELLGEFTQGSGFLTDAHGHGVDPEEVVPGLHLVSPTIPEAGGEEGRAREGNSGDFGGGGDFDAPILRSDR